MKTGEELRELFVHYFQGKQHKLVRSAPLIPAKDPTLLFTNAGMVQFKDVFLGKDHRPYKRATSCQKCLRVSGKHNDLEQVGHTLRHSTFFEMLGNFSFGDYFKREAIEFAYEFLFEVVGLDKNELWISVFEEDDEAGRLWEEIGVSSDRVVGLGEADNFWSMADTGPCGPCSELHIDLGEDVGCRRAECMPGCDCGRFSEIWNLVFMQYDRAADGTLNPLPAPSVDTGMGLERLACVCQHKTSIYETDLLRPIQKVTSELSGVRLTEEGQAGVAFRAIADHVRANCFLLADGIMPSNEGRGYILRKLIRRAARFGHVLGLQKPFLFQLAGEVISQMGGTYPELHSQKEQIPRIIKSEEERFQNTLNRCLPLVEDYVREVKAAGGTSLDGERVFSFYDTYGFPVDLIRVIAKENGLSLDEEGFDGAMLEQKERARTATKAYFGSEAEDEHHFDLCRSEFVGYEQHELGLCRIERIMVIAKDGKQAVSTASEGNEVEVVLDKTPFYAESGGQVSDIGDISSDEGNLHVDSVQKTAQGTFVHRGVVRKGVLKTGDDVSCRIDTSRRAALARGHTATHLLHFALRTVLGQHVKQSGSLVEPDRLRFDFTHFGRLSERELSIIEGLVNEKVREDVPVTATTLSFDKAIDEGALAFFGEKYGDVVRVVDSGGFSKELCGGTHVSRTGELGLFRMVSSSSVSAGVRRIEALTGAASLEYDNRLLSELQEVWELLKCPAGHGPERVKSLLAELKLARRDLSSRGDESTSETAEELVRSAEDVKGVKLITGDLGEVGIDFLRKVSDKIKDSGFSGVAVLGAHTRNKVILVCLVSADLTDRVDAGHIIREVSAEVGGSGGGRRDFAQAGGSRPERLDAALASAREVISEHFEEDTS